VKWVLAVPVGSFLSYRIAIPGQRAVLTINPAKL
jgi:hypothetical protein